MNIPHPTRTTLILSLCLAVLAGMLGHQHHQLSQLDNSLAATADKDALKAIQAQLDDANGRLDDTDTRHQTSNDDFRSGQQALSHRIDGAQAETKKAIDTAEELSRHVASEIVILKASIEALDNRLQKLSDAQVKRSPDTAPKAAVAQKNPPTPKAIPRQPPPFTVIGIEYRGGELFLAVAPLGSTQLSQIYLIRPGDAVVGTSWRLSSLDAQAAHFDVAGTPQIVNVAQ